MEAIAADLAVEATKGITKAVAGRLFGEITLVWGSKGQLEKLKNRFEGTQKLLANVGNGMSSQSELVKRWLDRVKDVAGAAENLLDDHAYEMLRRKLEPMKPNHRPSFKKKCRKYLMAPSFAFSVRMTRRVNRILSEFNELDKEAKNIGLKQVKLATEAVSAASTSAAGDKYGHKLKQFREHADAPGSEFTGREDDIERLHQEFRNHSATSQLHLPIVIAVVGMGGLGKTTLARRIHDADFSKKKVWIFVSEVFDVNRILMEMLESVSSTKCELSNTGAIEKKLKEELKGEKLMLILDDVWEKDQGLWDSLRYVLQRISEPSKIAILITTRFDEVAKKAGAVYTHKLEDLSEDDGWALLLKKTGINTDRACQNHSEFEIVGRKIVKKCKGVPLAIKAVGGVLKSKESPLEWKSILNSNFWDLQLDDKDSIFPSLLLSYNHLPCLSVKQCFTSCAFYPKGYSLEKRVLIALWMAEGFLDESKMGKDGEDHFGVLLNNSFLEEREEVIKIDEIKRYKMHDLMHDLANYVLQKDLLVLKADSKLEDASGVRHAVIINHKEEETMLKAPTTMAKRNLKTISCLGGVPRWDLIMGARYLRVLVVTFMKLREISPTIGQLTHLRYLDLSHNDINTLPESICKLYQLQTLRLEDNYRMKELPRELYKLENLRWIDVGSYPSWLVFSAWRGLGHLTKLQELPPLKLCGGEAGWTIDELEAMDQIKGQLSITGLQHVKNKEQAKKASLGRKDGILELELNWRVLASGIMEEDSKKDMNIDADVLDCLEPPQNITSLIVRRFLGKRFPCWVKTMVVNNTVPLSNLIKVELSDCHECEQVPTLGQLPNLKILKLWGFDKVECIGNEFYESSQNVTTDITNVEPQHGTAKNEQVLFFRALRELYIQFFPSLTTWMPAVSAASVFPDLEIMEIEFCVKLESVPAFHLPSLKRLALSGIVGTQPVDTVKYNNLVTLKLVACGDIKSLSVGEMMMMATSLKELQIDFCTELVIIYIKSLSVGEMMMMATSLKELKITHCSALVSIPTSIEICTSLESLDISDCPLIKHPVPDISKLQRLGHLNLVNSGELVRVAGRSIPHLHLLRSLEIGGFREEEEFNTFVYELTTFTNLLLKSIHSQESLSLLKRVELRDCPNIKSLPQQLQHLLPPSTLQELSVYNFDELEVLPEWIDNLSSLQELKLRLCKKLKSLPSRQAMLRLSQLQHLNIARCPLLEQRCDKNSNEAESEWHKISHIPFIICGKDIVQDLH